MPAGVVKNRLDIPVSDQNAEHVGNRSRRSRPLRSSEIQLTRERNAPCRTSYSRLLPLNRARRLAGHVIDHAVDARDLVDDAGRDRSQKYAVERIEIRG